MANQDLLKKTAESIGLIYHNKNRLTTKNGETITLQDGKAICDERLTSVVNKLRVAYCQEAVKTVAQKLGWTRTVKGTNKLSLRKGF